MWYAKLLLVPLDRIYLWLCAPVLVAMVYILPPFQAPDEVAHYYRSIQISHGEVMPVLVNSSYRPASGGFVDASAVRFARHHCGVFTWVCLVKDRPSSSEIFGAARSGTGNEAVQLAAFSNTVVYLPLAHLIPAIAIAFARSTGLGTVGCFYAGRLANALFSLAATWLAIRIVRRRQIDVLLFAIATLPMTLSLDPTLSADAGVISCSLLLVAVSVRLLSHPSAPRWVWPILMTTVPWAAAAKIAYLPLAFVPPACAYPTRGRSRVFIVTLLLAIATVAATAAWSSLTRNYVFPISADDQIQINGQLTFVCSHPLSTLVILLRSMVLDAPHVLLTLVGWKLSGNTVFLPIALLAPPTVALAVALVISGTDDPSWALRGFVLVAILLTTILTLFFLFLQNSTVGGSIVEGYQGRYLLPVLPFVALVIPGWGPGLRNCTTKLRAAVVISSCLTVAGVALFLSMLTWQ